MRGLPARIGKLIRCNDWFGGVARTTSNVRVVVDAPSGGLSVAHRGNHHRR